MTDSSVERDMIVDDADDDDAESDDSDLVVVVEVFPVVVDELSDAGSSGGSVATAERHVIRLVAASRANAITDVWIGSVDKFVGHPSDTEPVSVLVVTAAFE